MIDIKIAIVTDNVEEAAIQMVNKMIDDDSEIVTIIYGADTNRETAQHVEAAVEELDDELEVEVHEGDQPVYPFVISVE